MKPHGWCWIDSSGAGCPDAGSNLGPCPMRPISVHLFILHLHWEAALGLTLVKTTWGHLPSAMLWPPPWEGKLTTEDLIVVSPEVCQLRWSVVKFIPVGCQDEPERESMTKGLRGKQKSQVLFLLLTKNLP